MDKDQEAVDNQAVTDEAEAIETDAAEASETESTEDSEGEDLRLLLEDARSKADEHWDQLVRARAEVDNLRKRHERELENAHKFALERFVSELLAVRDSMELGLGATQEEGADLDKLIEGTELTLKLLSDVMERFDVVQISPEGEPFNPEFHQAMSMQPRDDVPPNTVVTVIQKGYTLNGRLVRPAMVMVSQGASGGIDERA
ncbi:nucleotide exchange factor GrpE [Solemya velesiana gill symbiont]|uniref:Protein GrpE n=1 Tax=Solemya velesiana gill symbiont TaxID=1918948 RepID=A0A1T2KU23_9GAMM|nr:nucleotide exchange factor GrpE [Solemya velesiana gill symbiont]OOZ36240.1 nucleotide exchange factor GrpE [Solemya velesiana gill symbiont]